MEKGVSFKEELNALLQKEVTKPLQMEHTTFLWDDYLEAHKVYGHDENGEPTFNKPGPGRWSGKQMTSILFSAMSFSLLIFSSANNFAKPSPSRLLSLSISFKKVFSFFPSV